MSKGKARSSQLIIFDDGTIYHIDLKRSDNVPRNILLVGASGRVDLISSHFNEITFQHRNKERPEFHTVAGTYKGIPVAAMSIGIGIGPIDIVINELHALFEYDHTDNSWGNNSPNVNIVRVGTCGTSLPNVPAGALAVSTHGLGLDNLGAYYPLARTRRDQWAVKIEREFLKTIIGKTNPLAYCSSASPKVIYALKNAAELLGEDKNNVVEGITTASIGFFGPEGRRIGRIGTAFGPDAFKDVIQSFNVNGLRIVNHEMEASALFRLGYEHLSYNVGAICLVVDNLATDDVLTGDEAKDRMHSCIRVALESLVALSK